MNFRRILFERGYMTTLLLVSGCPMAWSTPTNGDAGSLQTYAARGVVEKIARDHHQVTIHHQAIPGYMMEMTMDFPIRNTNEVIGISAGDKITFVLSVTKETEWIDHIHQVGHADEAANSTVAMPRDTPSKLGPGDKLPDGDFVTEDGRNLHFSDFRGKVVAFTFFFTRCPLPDYCPLMNRNFEKTRQILLSSSVGTEGAAKPAASANWQLLSLSFDSGFDHPEVLSTYAESYRGDNPDHWLFAAASATTLAEVGAPLGLMIMRQNGGIAHNLRTVVLDPQGRIYHQFNDNQWTPEQLAQVMREAMQAGQNQQGA
jgi:protein SCO1/2